MFSSLLRRASRAAPRRLSDESRPFRVLGVQQIAIGGPSKKALGGLWHELLGITKLGEHTSSVDNVAQDVLSVGPRPFNVEIDLMQPLDASAKPNPAAPALHHVGLWVDKLPEAVAYLEARGVEFVGGENAVRRGAANCDIAFIHPKGGGQGVLVELVQAPPAVRTALAEVEAVAGVDARAARPSATGARPELRFAEGQRVTARVGEDDWQAGTVGGLWSSEEDWPATEVAPYKIALADGPDIYAPLDDDLVVRAAKDE